MLQELKRQVKHLIKPPFINYIDVGAAGRLQNPWKRHRDKIHYWLRFEPNEDGMSQDATQTSMDTAIWHQQETRQFFMIGNKGHGSSLLEPDTEYVREHYEMLKQHGDSELAATWFERSQVRESHTVTTRSLDNVLDELDQQDLYHFLKTDTQGADYYVFKGAERLLSGSCIAIQSEQFIYPLYKESVLLNETTDYLAQFGFELVKKFPSHGTFLSQHDCLYMKTSINNKVSRVIRAMYNLD